MNVVARMFKLKVVLENDERIKRETLKYCFNFTTKTRKSTFKSTMYIYINTIHSTFLCSDSEQEGKVKKCLKLNNEFSFIFKLLKIE